MSFLTNCSHGKISSFQNDEQKIVAEAAGELCCFESELGNFMPFLSNIHVFVVEDNIDAYQSFLQFNQSDGNLLMKLPITNSLLIQHNKESHSMIFTTENKEKHKTDVLSFIFNDKKHEEFFKTEIGIKLFEFNSKQSFENFMKKIQNVDKNGVEWIKDCFEIAEESNKEYVTDENDYMILDEKPNNVVDTSDMDIEDEIENNFIACSNITFEENETKYHAEHDFNYLNVLNNLNGDVNCLESSPFTCNGSSCDENSYKNIENSENNKNKNILGSKCFNRAFVIRDIHADQSSVLGCFKYNENNDLEYENKIEITNMKNASMSPDQCLLHQQNRQLLLLTSHDPEFISVLNLDRGKVVEEWKVKDKDCGGITYICPIKKYDDMTDNRLIYGLNDNSIFLIDGRIPNDSKVVASMSYVYQTRTQLSCIATTGQGFIVTGSNTGQIRLHDQINKRAKTLLLGLGNPIKYIETTEDGKWILCTCQNYIIVIPTTFENNQRFGFESHGMRNFKQKLYILRLKNQDIIKYNLRNINFTKAHFDVGKNIDEHWIVTSTDSFIIKWNFRHLKQTGMVNDYQIRKANNHIVHNEFRYNFDNDLLVSETNSVYVQHSHKL